MSDNRRQYQMIRNALKKCYPVEPEGRLARHLNTLSGLVSGIVSSGRTNLPQIATKVPDETLPDSRAKRFSRWVDNERIDLDTYFLPYAQHLLASLSGSPLFLIMDGSGIGRGCSTLVLNVVYKQRALPLVWLVTAKKKGHFAEVDHIELVEQVQALLPEGADVVFLGDGEFDGVDLLHRLDRYGWQYVCRTAKSSIVWQGCASFSLRAFDLSEGQRISCANMRFTQQAYGPVHLILWWAKGYEEPLYLVTNGAKTEQACAWYGKRFRIETFFSDQKSRGFHLHKSHLADPEKLERLMMAACLAYIWIIYLGCMAIADGWVAVIHRSHRCDLSLFQLGLRLRDFFLNEVEDVPIAFHILLFDDEESVR